MKLKTQLLLVACLMLALPWAGCQSIKELAKVMGESQQINMATTLKAGLVLLENQQELIPRSHRETLGDSVYAIQQKGPITLDGYQDDWIDPPVPLLKYPQLAGSNDIRFTLKAKKNEDYLYLLIKVYNPRVLYYTPDRAKPYDNLLLDGIGADGNKRHFMVRSESPGQFGLLRLNEGYPVSLPSFPGYWRDTNFGYVIELGLPLALFSQGLGYSLSTFNELGQAISISSKNTYRPVTFLHPELTRQLSPLTDGDLNLFLVNKQGWLLAQAKPKNTRPLPPGYWMLENIYSYILDDGTLPPWRELFDKGQLLFPQLMSNINVPTWFKDQHKQRLLMVTPLSLDNGDQLYYLIASQPGDSLYRLAGTAFNRLFVVSLIVMVLAGIGLLSYASWLTYRIRQLSNSAADSLASDAEFSGALPLDGARDELGDLSRSFRDLLSVKQQQTDYLATLASKLSHELRTPLAVVRSSLDNLESLPPAERVFVERASSGCDRLSQILYAMSEAKRLEQSLDDYEKEPVPIAAMMAELHQVYSQTYPEQSFEFNTEINEALTLSVYPELLVQALDKLVDNAVDFSVQGAPILLSVSLSPTALKISVYNQGPALPEHQENQIFQSLVSLRQEKEEKLHLGLGLHIVQLVCKLHKGSVVGVNKDKGVIFTMNLPI